MDELKSEDIDGRVQAMQRIATISVALGPDRSRAELLPFLDSTLFLKSHSSINGVACLEEEDEVLYCMAQQLPSLIEPIGGATEAWRLVPLLERLATSEETAVRQQAVDSFQTIIGELKRSSTGNGDASPITEHVWPAVQRLAAGRWMGHRQSAAALLVPIAECGRVDGERVAQMLFAMCSSDEASLVRRAALPELARLAGHHGEKLDVLARLSDDPQDSIRMLIPPVLWTVRSTECREGVVTLAKQLAMDQSWRVRYMLTDTLPSGIDLLLPSDSTLDATQMYIGLLTDAESEVRAAAGKRLAELCRLLPPADVERITDELGPLVLDPQPSVRAALASNVALLSSCIGSER